MGTTSLHNFFLCGGFTSTHWRDCAGGESWGQTLGGLCADCIEQSVRAGLAPLSECKQVDAYTQIDAGPNNMPQVERLEEIVLGVPRATFILTFRNMTSWVRSLRYNNMLGRFRRENITGLPAGVGGNVAELSSFYCEHVKRVREVLARNPHHLLIELDIEDPLVSKELGDIFGFNRTSCWGHHNKVN